RQERGELAGPFFQDALPLGLGQLDPELGRESKYDLLLEPEQLLERPRRRRHGPDDSSAGHDRRREVHRPASLRWDRDGALHHALGPQQSSHPRRRRRVRPLRAEDRKSTRLNSSHRTISYAVFCLKKKKNN